MWVHHRIFEAAAAELEPTEIEPAKLPAVDDRVFAAFADARIQLAAIRAAGR